MNDESHPKVAPETLGARSFVSVPPGADIVREPSAWLRGVAAERVRQIAALHLDTSDYGAIIAPIGRTGPPGSRVDRSCDRCGDFVPPGSALHLFLYRASSRVSLAGGLCGSCARKEGTR